MGRKSPIETPRHFETLFLVDEILGWIAASRVPQRMRVKETLLRRFFNRGGSFGMSPAALLQDWHTFGLAFADLVIRVLDIYVQALDGVGFLLRCGLPRTKSAEL